jgi:hypothetical protein
MSSMSQIWTYFKSTYEGTGGGMAQFRKDWQDLTEQDRDDLRNGLEDGTLTYPDVATPVR